MKNDRSIFLRALLVALLGLAVLWATAQVVNEDDLRKYTLAGNQAAIVDLTYLPRTPDVWALCASGDKILVVDTTGWNVVRTIPITGFTHGAALSSSADGRFVLLKGTPPYGDPSKPKGRHVAVLDATTGAVLVDVPVAIDACLVPSTDALAWLGGEMVTVKAFGGSERSFKVPGAASAIAIDAQAKYCAVGLQPDAASLLQVPAIRNDKKALKAALKFRQLLVIYALADGTRLHLVPEVYDRIQELRFTDTDRLLVYNVPDYRSGAAAGGHVDQVDATAWQPLRTSFMTWTIRPPMAIAPSGACLALSSVEGKNKRKLTLYELATGDTQLMIDLEQKHRYDKAEGELHDARLGYTWLPDGRLLVAQGPSIGCYAPR